MTRAATRTTLPSPRVLEGQTGLAVFWLGREARDAGNGLSSDVRRC